MEQLIRTVIGNYSMYASQAQFNKSSTMPDGNTRKKRALKMLERKISAIEAWLNLLNADEEFVVRKHLIDELEWPRVAFEYAERWKREFTRTERSLVGYQANALKKIMLFCKENQDVIEDLFAEERYSLQTNPE